MEQVGDIEIEPFSVTRMNGLSSDSFEIINRKDTCRSVDCFEQFEEKSLSEDDFEVKIDEELLYNVDKRQTLQSCVFTKFKKFNINIDGEEKRRISVKRQRKKLNNFSGFLLKKSGSFFHGWQKRFVYLDENRLCYYKDKNDLTPCGIINLGIVDAKVKITKKNSLVFSIIIEGCKREFKFKARSQEERNQWGAEIIKHIVETNDADTKNSEIIKEERFWKQCDRVNEQTFKLEADSGDILLFKGKSFSSKMTRKLTNSDYDHVGMVLTFLDDDEIYILEATSDGVHIISWTDCATFRDRVYSKVVWRKLYCNRDDAFCEILQTFVEAVEDKKYKISISKLLKRTSLMPRQSQITTGQKLIEENRTFFCSELIAKAFKTLGILITNKSSAKIYPAHFSTKKRLELTNAVLGEELLISSD